jgi:hypothetical protein
MGVSATGRGGDEAEARGCSTGKGMGPVHPVVVRTEAREHLPAIHLPSSWMVLWLSYR